MAIFTELAENECIEERHPLSKVIILTTASEDVS